MECKELIQNILDGFKKNKNAFSAIGDETRQNILLVLLESDLSGIRVGEIAKKTHLTRPSVSHHLKILKEAGIVAMRRDGTKNYYYLNANETKWKDIAELVNNIYKGFQHICSEERKLFYIFQEQVTANM